MWSSSTDPVEPLKVMEAVINGSTMLADFVSIGIARAAKDPDGVAGITTVEDDHVRGEGELSPNATVTDVEEMDAVV